MKSDTVWMCVHIFLLLLGEKWNVKFNVQMLAIHSFPPSCRHIMLSFVYFSGWCPLFSCGSCLSARVFSPLIYPVCWNTDGRSCRMLWLDWVQLSPNASDRTWHMRVNPFSWIHQPNHSFHSRNRKLIIVTAEFSSQPVNGKYRSFQLHTCVWLNMRKFIIIISSSTIITIFRVSSTIITVSVNTAASNTKSK